MKTHNENKYLRKLLKPSPLTMRRGKCFSKLILNLPVIFVVDCLEAQHETTHCNLGFLTLLSKACLSALTSISEVISSLSAFIFCNASTCSYNASMCF